MTETKETVTVETKKTGIMQKIMLVITYCIIPLMVGWFGHYFYVGGTITQEPIPTELVSGDTVKVMVEQDTTIVTTVQDTLKANLEPVIAK